MRLSPRIVFLGAASLVLTSLATLTIRATAPTSNIIQFVFTSDAHYGLTRAFRGGANVDASTVNQALVRAINALPDATLAGDGGINAGQPVGPIDFVVEGGDIANREEMTDAGTIQPAAASWAQFRRDYIEGLRVVDSLGEFAPLYIVPGNHDVSNAIGFYKRMEPAFDNTSMVEIFNRMLLPAVPKTTSTFSYTRDKVLYTHDLGRIHFMFLSIWPDSSVRAWMERDLRHVSRSTPVVLFTHDQPELESKHARNPNGQHDINERDKFENMLVDDFADSTKVTTTSLVEQRQLESFFAKHRNVAAYFHGNSNWNQFYDWTGPRHSIALHTFRVDSPMKGAVSSKDETKLSFQLATIDTSSLTMTVRECLWNVDTRESGRLVWGDSTTVRLKTLP